MLVAQKPCSFAGQKFIIGDVIPDHMVLPEAKTRLVKGGVIAEVAGDGSVLLPVSPSSESRMVSVPILADEGEAFYDVSIDDLLEAIRVIQKPEDGILEYIKTATSEDALILIDVLTGATEPIHGEARKRALELNGEEEPSGEEAIPAYPKYKLEKLNKAELTKIATELGLTVGEEDTNAMIREAILAKQAGSDA